MKAAPRKFGRWSSKRLLDLFFPRRCLSCRDFLRDAVDSLCPSCSEKWPSLEPPFCSLCSYPFSSSETTSHLCGDCLSRERSCRRVRAVGLYRGILHDLIVRLKYQKEERLASYLGQRMSKQLHDSYDLIVPVPLYRDRLRERGFNQALLLAREVGKILKIDVDPLVLVKKKPTPPQAELKGDERRKNLRDAFEVRLPDKIQDKKILIVDDVYTTGTTVEEVARKLLKAGSKEVETLVLARAC